MSPAKSTRQYLVTNCFYRFSLRNLKERRLCAYLKEMCRILRIERDTYRFCPHPYVSLSDVACMLLFFSHILIARISYLGELNESVSLISLNNFILCFRCERSTMKLLLAGVMCLLVANALASKDEKDKAKEVGTVIGIDLGTTYSW